MSVVGIVRIIDCKIKGFERCVQMNFQETSAVYTVLVGQNEEGTDRYFVDSLLVAVFYRFDKDW